MAPRREPDTTLREWVGKRLQRLSREKGLTSARVAAALGVSDSLVRRWHQGNREPSLSNLADYAALLELPLSELLGEARTDLPEELIAVLGRMDAGAVQVFYDFAVRWLAHDDRLKAERWQPPAEEGEGETEQGDCRDQEELASAA